MGIYQCLSLVKKGKQRWIVLKGALTTEEADKHLSSPDQEDLDRRTQDFALGRWFYKSIKENCVDDEQRWVLYHATTSYD